jgi:hypothetical protein
MAEITQTSRPEILEDFSLSAKIYNKTFDKIQSSASLIVI